MKKTTKSFICITLIALFILVLPSCNNNSNKPQYQFADYSIEEQVVVDENGIKVTALGAAYDEYGNPGVKLRIENNSPSTVGVSISADTVNEIFYSTTFGADEHGKWLFSANLESGKNSEIVLALNADTLSEIGIQTIKSFGFYVDAFLLGEYNSEYDSYEIVDIPIDNKPVKIKTSLFDNMDQALTLDGIELYNDNGVRLTIEKSKHRTSSGTSNFYFALQNLSNEYFVDAYVFAFETIDKNGSLVTLLNSNLETPEFNVKEETVEVLRDPCGGAPRGISKGCVAISPALGLEAALLDNGFKEINTLRLCFTINFTDSEGSSSAYRDIIDNVGNINNMDMSQYFDDGVYTKTVDINFDVDTVATVWEYNPSDLISAEYTIDNGNGNIGQTVIFDEQGLKITVASLSANKEYIDLIIENNSTETFGVFFDNSEINDVALNNAIYMYSFGLYSYFGLCDLSAIQPGAHIETQYGGAPVVVAKDSATNDTNTAITNKGMKTMSFTLVICESSQPNSDGIVTEYSDGFIRAKKLITLNVDAQ